MKRLVVNGWIVLTLGLFLSVTGCATYYKVTDPQSGKIYYTEKLDYMKGGAVQLKDAKSGSVVTIQNSEVKQVGSDEYKAGLYAPAAPSAAPASAPAPATTPAPAPASAP